MKNKLKPCPFCKNKKVRMYTVRSVKRNIIVGYHVFCEPKDYHCGVHGPIMGTKFRAFRTWNTRL